MKHPALHSRYRKNRSFLDYDYLDQLSADDLAFLEAFTASFYNGAPSNRPGSVGEGESHRLNTERRRDVFAALVQVDHPVDQLTEYPPHRSDFSESRRKYRKSRRKTT